MFFILLVACKNPLFYFLSLLYGVRLTVLKYPKFHTKLVDVCNYVFRQLLPNEVLQKSPTCNRGELLLRNQPRLSLKIELSTRND
jgi:hypothetical protein